MQIYVYLRKTKKVFQGKNLRFTVFHDLWTTPQDDKKFNTNKDSTINDYGVMGVFLTVVNALL